MTSAKGLDTDAIREIRERWAGMPRDMSFGYCDDVCEVFAETDGNDNELIATVDCDGAEDVCEALCMSTRDVAALLAEVERLRGEVERYSKREAHFASALAVADGGRYRADWDGAIRRLIAEVATMRPAWEAIERTVETAAASSRAWVAWRASPNRNLVDSAKDPEWRTYDEARTAVDVAKEQLDAFMRAACNARVDAAPDGGRGEQPTLSLDRGDRLRARHPREFRTRAHASHRRIQAWRALEDQSPAVRGVAQGEGRQRMFIYKRGDIWWARVPNPNGGRRLRVSTHCTDKKAAELAARDLERRAVDRPIVPRTRSRSGTPPTGS